MVLKTGKNGGRDVDGDCYSTYGSSGSTHIDKWDIQNIKYVFLIFVLKNPLQKAQLSLIISEKSFSKK